MTIRESVPEPSLPGAGVPEPVPELEEQLAFNRRLNERMPTKRLIAQGLVRSPDGRVLLCELTYKDDWDLPGGIVDPGESPAQCVVREVREELGFELAVRSLLAVNWLPPYRGWDDALLCLFDLGVIDPGALAGARLLEREIRAAHWVAPAAVPDHVAPYTAEMLNVVLDPGTSAMSTVYLEQSRHPDAAARR